MYAASPDCLTAWLLCRFKKKITAVINKHKPTTTGTTIAAAREPVLSDEDEDESSVNTGPLPVELDELDESTAPPAGDEVGVAGVPVDDDTTTDALLEATGSIGGTTPVDELA